MVKNSKNKSTSARVRPSDLREAIWRDSDKEDPISDDLAQFGNNIERYVEVFTLSGQHDFDDPDDYPALLSKDGIDAEDRPEAYAKIVIVNQGDPRYSIRRDAQGNFYDPLGLYSEGRHNKMTHHTQVRQWEWVETNKRAFEYYMRYLQTRNKAHFTNAQREAF